MLRRTLSAAARNVNTHVRLGHCNCNTTGTRTTLTTHLEHFRLELSTTIELVVCTLVDEQVQVWARVRLHQFRCIILLPRLLVVTEIPAQRLSPPITAGGATDRRKR